MPEHSSEDDGSSTQSVDAAYQCDNCDSLLDLSSWTPTVTEGDAEIYRFCDPGCRQEWRNS